MDWLQLRPNATRWPAPKATCNAPFHDAPHQCSESALMCRVPKASRWLCPQQTVMARSSDQLAPYHLPCACSAPKGLQVAGPDGEVYSLSRYYANWTLPRPESYTEDVQSAAGMTPDAQAQLWRDLASGAESGGPSLLQTLRRANNAFTEPCWATWSAVHGTGEGCAGPSTCPQRSTAVTPGPKRSCGMTCPGRVTQVGRTTLCRIADRSSGGKIALSRAPRLYLSPYQNSPQRACARHQCCACDRQAADLLTS